MSESKITVCNQALALLGDKSRRMTSFESPTHPHEQACVDNYDQARDEALARFDWPFARKFVALTVSENAPALTYWTYKYARPSDAVVIRAVTDADGAEDEYLECTEERIVGETVYNDLWIYSNVQNAYCRHTYRLDNPAVYSPGMIRLQALLLAEKIAVLVTGKIQIQEALAFRIVKFGERECLSMAAKDGYIEEEKGHTQYTDLF